MQEFSQEYCDFLTRKLAHYNAWLMDNKRPITQVYPGFPEELKMKEKAAKATATVVKKARVAKMPARVVSVKKVKQPKAGSKQSIANEIVRAAYAVAAASGSGSIDKANVILQIVKDCQMTQAGATTYFYNAVKAVS